MKYLYFTIVRTIVVMIICSQYLRNISVPLPSIKDKKVVSTKVQVISIHNSYNHNSTFPCLDIQTISHLDHDHTCLGLLRHPHCLRSILR